jgi:hypothetical protein
LGKRIRRHQIIKRGKASIALEKKLSSLTREKQKLTVLKGIFMLNNSKNPNDHLILFIEEE